MILIPTWLWSLGLISNIDPLLYKVVWWAMGHSSQQINVSAHVVALVHDRRACARGEAA